MVSLCMIVRDEEDVLGRCLESVKGLFDEICIVDTGSHDGTVSVAKKYTDKLFFFEWCDDFSAARNYAFSHASGDYLFWLDADDVVEKADKELLYLLFSQLDAISPDVVMLPYNVAFDPSGRVLLSYERERLVRAGCGFEFSGAVHEAITPRGKIIHFNAAISHRKTHPSEPGRNLRILEKQISENGGSNPRNCYYFARELSEAHRLDEAIFWYTRCAENPTAWIENRKSAYLEMSRVFLLQNRPDDAQKALFKALELGAPRADLCCELGRNFLEKNDLKTAEFWYKLAPEQFLSNAGGFVHADCGDYIPYLQLCVINDRLGNKKEAARYNRLAWEVYPDSEACRKNAEYFKKLGIDGENN